MDFYGHSRNTTMSKTLYFRVPKPTKFDYIQENDQEEEDESAEISSQNFSSKLGDENLIDEGS